MEEPNKQDPSEFMKETIKQRPLNRRKLIRRTLITAAMAVVFGLVACLTFLFLEPIISNRLNPEEEPQKVTFVDEPVEKEKLPEDMIADESEVHPGPTKPPVLGEEQIEQVLSKMELGIEDYLSLTGAVSEVAKQVQNSTVQVIGITSDMDWFDNEYESSHSVSGVIIADNGKELLILANIEDLKDAESMEIIFYNGRSIPVDIKEEDALTGLSVLSVSKSILPEEMIETAIPITLGTSSNKNLPGNPVIAVGSPMGTENSVCVGRVTASGSRINLPDSLYTHLGTDIYGSPDATGILVNMRGQLIGIVDMSYNTSDMKNLISGFGISELKKLIESLSNGQPIVYFGVYGTDVTEEINKELQVPLGAYITKTEMDSPAMNAGIQSGDVIIQLGETKIETYQNLVDEILNLKPGQEVPVKLMRQGPDGYIEMAVTITTAADLNGGKEE